MCPSFSRCIRYVYCSALRHGISDIEGLPYILLGCIAQSNFWLLLPTFGFWKPFHRQSGRPLFLTERPAEGSSLSQLWWPLGEQQWVLQVAVTAGIISKIQFFFREGVCKFNLFLTERQKSTRKKPPRRAEYPPGRQYWLLSFQAHCAVLCLHIQLGCQTCRTNGETAW